MPVTVPPTRLGKGTEVTSNDDEAFGLENALRSGYFVGHGSRNSILRSGSGGSAAGALPVESRRQPLTFDGVSIREDNFEPAPQNHVQNPMPPGQPQLEMHPGQ